jgi:hypothetical protein
MQYCDVKRRFSQCSVRWQYTFPMTAHRKIAALLLLLLVALGGCLVISWPHWLAPHGRATCAGQPIVDARVYRSKRGDVFVYAPNVNIQPAVVSPKSRDFGRCNTPAFTPVFGLLFSREADPSVQCTSMWKGGGSDDIEPPHIVTETYAEFPWGSCDKLRVDY